MSSSRSSQRSSISPFRSRRNASSSATTSSSSASTTARAAAAASASGGRPATPASVSSRPSTPSSLGGGGGRPGTPLSSSSSFSARPPGPKQMSPEMAVVSGMEPPVRAKESVTVTVRFRPLNSREINRGDEIAWYADGDYTVRSEHNASIAYGFDRVFGPATTTRHVYDVAAQHVVSGSMQGINGTVFAYGVTSSGKTHTMHGEQKSPGIIPLAIKDVFSIIQESPGREFLLRVSYLEIYNEVINDLLDPTGQNLRIREDSQGTYVEGIKEEVVLSPAHALALIASGEEHRHVGSNNFNLLSSRSHTIFTLTVESSPSGDNRGEEDVTLSQLNLIDLAGSESSKTETTGLRRKEGSYINKSLLTLGTVISKLTDGKAAHVPYRDSKLTRLLQSSLSGHGRISLICTVTPASSNSEETHNTLKFAHRSKYVEIKAAQNKIMDEKSLIKKYQREIMSLKEELQQLKRGMMEKSYVMPHDQEDLVNLKLQLEAGQVKLQSRLEEEEQAKAALMGRIQRLTKLILVSTKNTISANISEKAGHRRRHSFGEDELAYLPDRKREYIIDDDDALSLDSEFSSEGKCDNSCLDESSKLDKRSRKRGMLGWLKLKKPDGLSIDNDSSASGSPSCSQSQTKFSISDTRDGRRRSISKRGEDPSIVDSFPERTQAGELFSVTVKGRRPPPTGTTITDQMDLLGEQLKMLAGEVALSTSSLKRLSEQAVKNPEDAQIKTQMQKLKGEIGEKKLQMRVLEQRMIGSLETSPYKANNLEMSQALSKLAAQLNEKMFELEIMSADNRILQEQLQKKTTENAEIQETVLSLRQELDSVLDKNADRNRGKEVVENGLIEGSHIDRTTQKLNSDSYSSVSREGSCDGNNASLKSQVLFQAAEIESLKQEKVNLEEEKDGLEIHCQKLSEEASYAKELASAAAVELKNLAEEVTKLSYQNAKLTSDMSAAKELLGKVNQKKSQLNGKHDISGSSLRNMDDVAIIEDLTNELKAKCQREECLEVELSEKDRKEAELYKMLEESKRHEEHLENELASMWILVAKLKKPGTVPEDVLYQTENVSRPNSSGQNGYLSNNGSTGRDVENRYNRDKSKGNVVEELRAAYEKEKRRCKELECSISLLKSEDLSGLDATSLEQLKSFHVEALSRLCQEKLAHRVS